MTRRKTGPAREPHPDPRIEAQLQRILSERRMIAGKEELIERDRAEIAMLRAVITKHPNWDGLKRRQDQVAVLLAEIHATEAEILRLHDEIEARIDKISDPDLTAL